VLLLVLMLGIVLISVQWLRDPAIRRGLDLLLSPKRPSADGTQIDNRLEVVAPRNSLSGDVFVMPHNRQSADAADGDRLLGVRAEDLEGVRDDTRSTREEQACSLRLLDILNRTPAAAIRQASLGPVAYAQLFRQPDYYRGRLVTVSGIVRRATRVALIRNDYGIKEYYQVWLWPSDNPTAPIVVYCLRLPKGFPTGDELAEQSELTGLFFKRWAYQAQDAIRTAPALLARDLQWQPKPVIAPEPPPETWMVVMAIGGAVAAALLGALAVYLRTRPSQPVLPEQLPDFDALRTLEPHKGAADER
jgi:hypothetical protein